MLHSTLYSKNRTKFYKAYPDFWYDMYEEEYALFDVHKISSTFTEDTKTFAKNAGKILFKTCKLLQSRDIDDEVLQTLGFPKESISYIRLQTFTLPTVIGRLDSVLENGVHKVMEFNSDTPTFIYELFFMNKKICDYFKQEDPNSSLEPLLAQAMKNSIFESYSHLQKKEFPTIVFTSHNENQEDTETVKYLQRLCPLPSKYVPLSELYIKKDVGLFDKEGNQIDVLYRQTYPIEQLILDKDTTGNSIGLYLLELVEKKKLAVINPPAAFLLQNKAVLAVIWQLHEEQSPFFSSEEHKIIEKHFLPTYLEPNVFIKMKQPYVKKPVFGREGDTVEVFDGVGRKLNESKHKTYEHFQAVYQRYVPLPTATFNSAKGKQTGHIMYGTFLINGTPGAFGARIGQKITDNLSYFLPICLEKRNDTQENDTQ